MTAATLSGADATSVVLFAIIVLIIVRRVIGMVRGSAVRPARMFAVAALLAGLLVITLLLSYGQLPVWTYGVDVAVLVGASVLATGWVRRRVVLDWKDGAWTYRLGPLLPVVYLVLFVVRLALDLVVLGINPFAGTPPSATPLTGTTLGIVAVVDALFAFSTGLLVGRTVGVYLEVPDAECRRTSKPRRRTPTRRTATVSYDVRNPNFVGVHG